MKIKAIIIIIIVIIIISWVNSEQRLCVMVCQIVDGIFNPESPELPDVEFKSHGLKDFIKTGFR